MVNFLEHKNYLGIMENGDCYIGLSINRLLLPSVMPVEGREFIHQGATLA